MGADALVPTTDTSIDYFRGDNDVGLYGTKNDAAYRALGLSYSQTHMSTEEQIAYINDPNNNAVLLKGTKNGYMGGAEPFVLVCPGEDGKAYVLDPSSAHLDNGKERYNGLRDANFENFTEGIGSYILEKMPKDEWIAYSNSQQFLDDCASLGIDPAKRKREVDLSYGIGATTKTESKSAGEDYQKSTTDKVEKAKKWAEDAEDLYLTGLISKEEYEKAKGDYEKAKGESKVEKAKKWAQDAEDLYIEGKISKDEFEKAKENYEKAKNKIAYEGSDKTGKSADQEPEVPQRTFAEQVADYIGERAQTQTTDMTHKGETESMIVITDDSAALHMEIRDYIDDMQKSGKTEVEYKEIINDDGSKVTVITFKEPPPPPEEESGEGGDGSGGGGDAGSNIQKGIDKGKQAAEGGKKL